MGKDKKKKDKKAGGMAAKSAKRLQALTKNPLIADVVAAALVATASALKDSNKARRLAAEAGDELQKLSKKGAERGNALWDMALQIGRRSLESYATQNKPKAAKPKPGSAKRSTKKQPAAKKRR